MDVVCDPICYARYKAGRIIRSSCTTFLFVSLTICGLALLLTVWKAGLLDVGQWKRTVTEHREPLTFANHSVVSQSSSYKERKVRESQSQKRENALKEIEEKLTKIARHLAKTIFNNDSSSKNSLMTNKVKTPESLNALKVYNEGGDELTQPSGNIKKPIENGGLVQKIFTPSVMARPLPKYSDIPSVKQAQNDNNFGLEKQVSKPPIVSSKDDLRMTSKVLSNKPRRNIIIIAHGRSGSTITGDIFNQNPAVFYIFEPLQTVERITASRKGNYKGIENDVLTNMLRCRFSDEVALDIQHYYNKYPNSSKAIGPLVTSLCPYQRNDPKWDPNLCAPLKGQHLETHCRQHYQITVLKILIARISEKSIGNIMEACILDDIECKFVFLVRDPRAIIASSRSVSFFGGANKKEELKKYSQNSCQQTSDNILFVKNLHLQEKRRIMMIRYEDFAMDPLRALENLYNFTSLTPTKKLKNWLYQRTHPNDQFNSSENCKGVHGFCTIDDASKAVNRWRVKVSLEDIMVMEECCLNVLRLLGYKPIQWSKELLLDTNTPLFKEQAIAREWFSH